MIVLDGVDLAEIASLMRIVLESVVEELLDSNETARSSFILQASVSEYQVGAKLAGDLPEAGSLQGIRD